MRVRQQFGKLGSNKELTKKHALIAGASSIAVIVLAAAGTAAFNDSNSQTVNSSSRTHESTKTNTKVDISNDQLNAKSTTTPAEDVVSESYTETGDGQSQTKQYSTSTQDENGNRTTQEHSYTTNIDGSSAVDINLNSSSSSTGSVNSSSSVDVNVNSSSSVRSSGQE
ncbi:MAG: hypothetical protein V4678_03860 [Patescibacteria group bacterium]